MTIAVNRNLSNCEKARKKGFGASTGFEPVASALALQCSTSLSYEDPYTGGRPIYWVHQPVKGMKHRMKLLQVLRVFSFAEGSTRKKNSSTFSMEKGLTDLWAINTPRFVLPKEGFYSEVCAISEFIFFSGRNRLDNWLSFRLSLIVYCMHTFGYLSPKLFDHKNLFALSNLVPRAFPFWIVSANWKGKSPGNEVALWVLPIPETTQSQAQSFSGSLSAVGRRE